MIRFNRTEEPRILRKNRVKWNDALNKALSDYRNNPSKENKKKLDVAYGKYNQQEVKESLKDMFSGKCAYCESHITHIGYGHIEHFRPKSKFPNLCFDWNNLMLGCEICNGSGYKGDKFPEADEGGPFVNPVDENPDTFFKFEFDPSTGLANVISNNTRASITEKELGLNRPDLVKHRSYVVRKMVFAAIKANEGDLDAIREIKKCCLKEEEYSAFAKALVERFKIK